LRQDRDSNKKLPGQFTTARLRNRSWGITNPLWFTSTCAIANLTTGASNSQCRLHYTNAIFSIIWHWAHCSANQPVDNTSTGHHLRSATTPPPRRQDLFPNHLPFHKRLTVTNKPIRSLINQSASSPLPNPLSPLVRGSNSPQHYTNRPPSPQDS
jgi:hypothetical protein